MFVMVANLKRGWSAILPHYFAGGNGDLSSLLHVVYWIHTQSSWKQINIYLLIAEWGHTHEVLELMWLLWLHKVLVIISLGGVPHIEGRLGCRFDVILC
jgi:hypothetical protein